MNKISTRQIIFLVLTVIWMGVIFYYSAQEAESSGEKSGRVATLVCSVFVDSFDEMSQDEQLYYTDMVDYPIRKTAHALEYAILGALITGACVGDVNRQSENSVRKVFGQSVRYKWWIQFLVPWVATGLYAASDEFHQLFVKGRSGQISDVLLDMLGGAVGVLIMMLILRRSAKE